MMDQIRAVLDQAHALNEGTTAGPAWARSRATLRLASLASRLAAALAFVVDELEATPCPCDPAYTDRGRHQSDCFREDAEDLLARIRAALTEEAPL